MTDTETASRKRAALCPEQPQGSEPKTDRHWRSRFLDALAETSNVTQSAGAAGIKPSRAYKVRRQEPAFREAWMEALTEGYAHLEMETLHRLRMGTGGAKEDPKFDIANALRLLSMHRETVESAESRKSEPVRDEDTVLESLKAKLDLMQEREMQARADDAARGEYDTPIHADK